MSVTHQAEVGRNISTQLKGSVSFHLQETVSVGLLKRNSEMTSRLHINLGIHTHCILSSNTS
jgi:hypothetical protein